MIVHIGLWKIKENTSQEKIDEIFNLLSIFPEKVPGVLSVKYGKYEHYNWQDTGMLQHCSEPTSKEGDYGHGFNYGFSMLISDREARIAYDSDPLHVKIAGMIIALLDGGLEKGIIQFDFEC